MKAIKRHGNHIVFSGLTLDEARILTELFYGEGTWTEGYQRMLDSDTAGVVLGFHKKRRPKVTTDEDWLMNHPNGITKADVEVLIAGRAEARQKKNWELADRIRNHLEWYGIKLHDEPDGSTWWSR